LAARIKFLTEWAFHGEPATFWLAATYHPKMLLAAVLQRFAIKKGVLVDSLAFRAEETRTGEGVSVSGLVLVGASWDRKKKQLQDPKPKELYTEMPIVRLHIYLFLIFQIRLVPVAKDEIQTNTFSCPLFITTHKTNEIKGNFITHIVLPTTMPAKFWILRGVALYCQHVTQ
jgi:dynein heavy chain